MFKKIILFLGIVLFWGTINTSDRARIKYPFLEDSLFLGESECATMIIPQRGNQGGETVFLRSELYDKCGLKYQVCVLRSEKGDLLGDMLIRYEESYAEKQCTLSSIDVVPKHQGKGYGRIMIDYLKGQALKNECQGIELLALPDAVGFYDKLGFDKTRMVYGMHEFYCSLRKPSECKPFALQGALLPKVDMPF